MRVPLSWLRDFAPIEGDPADLAATLSDLGLVVEGLERVGQGLDRVVVGRVVETRAHPGADRVQLVDVDAGEGPVQVVCGAFNFDVGDLVPFAPPGAALPNGLTIQRRKVRGEWSEGMLCAPDELKLSDDHTGILVLPAGLSPGLPVSEALGLGPDVVFDIDVTPNRPDALSVAGVARDLAARLRVPFEIPEPTLPTDPVPATASLEVESLDLCPRFTATSFAGIAVGVSPPRMATRLTLAGMRPINGVVDISNYLMLELGHPNHPYDLDLLPGRGLSVRRGRAGETVVTLDGVPRAVGGDDCLIADAEGNAVGIGGIMGGASTEITESTTNVLLEVAYFDPLAIARTSKRLGLRTEASVRFERGVDPFGIDRAVARFGELLAEESDVGVVAETLDLQGDLPKRPRVRVRTTRVNAILGADLVPAAVAGYLEPIGFEAEPDSDGDFQVTIPSWRPDSSREIDVVEEVARHHGYGNIVRTLPEISRVGGLDAYQRERRRVREVLAGAGLSEAWTNSMVAPDDLRRAGLGDRAVEVENPLAQEESVLRTSMLPGLLKAVLLNQSHRNPSVALFEIGHVFLPPNDGDGRPEEPELLAVALAGKDAPEAKRVWNTLSDVLGIDQVALRGGPSPGLHPTRSAHVSAGDLSLGVIGEVDPDVLTAHGIDGRVAWLEVDLGRLLREAPRQPRAFRPVSRFPSADIDLAFEVPDGVAADAVERALRGASDLIESVRLFDVYRGNQLGGGARSLAFTVRFAALDHTLTEEELAALRQRCIDAVQSQVGATLRG